jgi:hypothetical protein
MRQQQGSVNEEKVKHEERHVSVTEIETETSSNTDVPMYATNTTMAPTTVRVKTDCSPAMGRSTDIVSLSSSLGTVAESGGAAVLRTASGTACGAGTRGLAGASTTRLTSAFAPDWVAASGTEPVSDRPRISDHHARRGNHE